MNKKEQARTSTPKSRDVTNTDLGTWPRVHTPSITLGMDTLPVTKTADTAHQLTEHKGPKIPPSGLLVAMPRCGMSLCGLPQVMDI